MSRFVDQFVLLFDASKLPADPPHPQNRYKNTPRATLHFDLGGICPLLLQKNEGKNSSQRTKQPVQHWLLQEPSRGGLVLWLVAVRYRLRRADAHMRLAGSVKPLLCALCSEGQTPPPHQLLRRLCACARCPPAGRGLGSGRLGSRCHARCRGVAWPWSRALTERALWHGGRHGRRFWGGRAVLAGSSSASRRCGLNETSSRSRKK
jgi:hypothetical protein